MRAKQRRTAATVSSLRHHCVGLSRGFKEFMASFRNWCSTPLAHNRSIILAPGRPVELLARLRRFGPLREVAAFFVAADALVRPESLEHEFRRRRCDGRIGFAVCPQPCAMI